MHEIYDEALRYLRRAWAYRWWGVTVAWALCVTGWIVVGLQKDDYEATAKVYINTSSELRSLLNNQITESPVDEQIRFVREALLGNIQLERVATSTGLLQQDDDRASKLAVVEKLRDSIEIVTDSDLPQNRFVRNNPDDIYAIRYRHHEDGVALGVVEEVIKVFQKDMLGARQSGSAAAKRFLMDQITDYEQRLQEAEDRLAAFKRTNFQYLPGRQGGYYDRLQSEIESLEQAKQELALAQSRLNRIRTQIRGESPRVAGEIDASSTEGRVRESQARLDDLLLTYTENHPDVIAVREALSELNQRRQAELRQMEDGTLPIRTDDPVYQALLISEDEMEEEVAALQTVLEVRSATVRELQLNVDEMPGVEAELARLNRDYDVINEHYQALLDSLERERLSRGVLESEQVDFRIIDEPMITDMFERKRLLLVIAVFLGAIGTAVATAILRAEFKPVYDRPNVLAMDSGLPVLGVVSNQAGWTIRSASTYWFLAGVGLLTISFIVFLVFEIAGAGLRGLI